MYKNEIFLTVEDMMILYDTRRYQTARKRHQLIRDMMGTRDHPKTSLTIREFCEFERFNFAEIWKVLRDTPVPPPLDE
jgi:hypothetical protein